MISFIANNQFVVEEQKMILEVDSQEEIKLDKIYMVMILHAMNFDFDHIRDHAKKV